VIRHVGEIGQPDAVGLVDLPEDHPLIRTVQRSPLANTTLEGPRHPPLDQSRRTRDGGAAVLEKGNRSHPDCRAAMIRALSGTDHRP
jgi:hypothetical protein